VLSIWSRIRMTDVPGHRAARRRGAHPLLHLAQRRTVSGIVTLFLVSVVIFVATEILPGNAAEAILGRNDTSYRRLHELELQLHLNRPAVDQYWAWLSGLFTGHLGRSLLNHQPVWSLVEPRLVDSAALLLIAGVLGSLLGVLLGAAAALRKDGKFDHVSSVIALAVTSLPEFVVAVILITILSTVIWHVLPAVSILPPGSHPWDNLQLLVLPSATLIIVIIPYTMRMMRAAMIEALGSDYVEMARLKGVPEWRVVLVHALPNAIAPTIQVIGLGFLYLAGGIVVVEYVFNFPGIGQELVYAVNGRDIPVIQFVVVMLAAFYVFVNIVADIVALLATPRRRIAR
jgi:peptide/nickel transport system permease protein